MRIFLFKMNKFIPILLVFIFYNISNADARNLINTKKAHNFDSSEHTLIQTYTYNCVQANNLHVESKQTMKLMNTFLDDKLDSMTIFYKQDNLSFTSFKYLQNNIYQSQLIENNESIFVTWDNKLLSLKLTGCDSTIMNCKNHKILLKDDTLNQFDCKVRIIKTYN